MDIGMAETDEEREATYRFINDEITDQHHLVMEQARGLDTKATVLAGFAAAGVSFLLTHPRGTIWWAALACYLAALALALGALWPRRWHALDLTTLQEELSEAAPVFVVGKVAGAKVAVVGWNSAKAQLKALLWTASVVVLAAGAGLSVWTTITEAMRT